MRPAAAEAPPKKKRSRLTVVGVAALAAAGLAVLVLGGVTGAAFVDTTENRSNTFQSGDVVLDDDDQGNALFSVSDLAPGATVTRCIKVTYTGSLTANVHLYGSVGGSGLAGFLDTDIEVGAGGDAASCAGFVSSSTLYTGTLTAFGISHTNYVNGLRGFDGATDPSARTYRVSVTLRDDPAAQSLGGSLDLIWEAQNQ
jgi:predicted ribosomally synthesized peptide with SipW-like signal peptide